MTPTHCEFILHDLILDDNGIKDQDFAELINSLAYPDFNFSFLKKLYYQRNELGPESVKALASLVEIQCTEMKLESFKIDNVKVALPTISILMKTVLLEIPNIKILQLSNINLNSPTTIQDLVEVITI